MAHFAKLGINSKVISVEVVADDDCKNADVDLWFLALPNGLAEPYVNALLRKDGVKMIWAGTNPEESKIFMVIHMEDASQMKTFGERPDIFKARTEAGADVASTTVISPIGEDWLPN